MNTNGDTVKPMEIDVFTEIMVTFIKMIGHINQLPVYLRHQAIEDDTPPLYLAPLLNCLLYADDVVLIANRSTMVDLLRKCEEHSIQMGYRWNPSKCVILDNQPQTV